MKHFIPFILVLFVSTAMLTADEPSQTAPQPEKLETLPVPPDEPASTTPQPKSDSPKVPTFKDGEKIYLSVQGSIPRMVLYLSPLGKDEFNNKGFSKDDGYGDYLVPYDKEIDLRVWSRTGTNSEIMRVCAKDILDDLQKNIKESPNDKTKWKVVRENERGKITFTFAGIQRFYELQSIKIPGISTHRKNKQYEGGHAPGLRLRIDKNGKYMGYIQSPNKAWETSFPSGNANRIEVKTGTDERFDFRLRDWNVNMFEHPIADFLDITPIDFEKGSIVEEIGDFDDPKSAIELKFRRVRP